VVVFSRTDHGGTAVGLSALHSELLGEENGGAGCYVGLAWAGLQSVI
jgi:hypothetical protein